MGVFYFTANRKGFVPDQGERERERERTKL
jgi:hypothetical protein